jgi:oligosaccharide repeat unit polymerase
MKDLLMEWKMTRSQPVRDYTKQLTASSSVLMCVGLGITYLILPDQGSVDIYRTAAVGGALAIGLGILMEAQKGVSRLIRADLLALVALYGLTLVEFLFPQEAVKRWITAQSATQGVEALFLGFVGLIIGRNLAPKPRPAAAATATHVRLSPKKLFLLFLALLCLGYINMLMAVGFDPVELVHQMLRPRFSQPWQRGQLGGWFELVGELGGLLIYLIPTIAGSVLANRRQYTVSQTTIVGLGLAFTLFYGFSGGTRGVFIIYVVMFVGSYIIFKPGIGWRYGALLACVTAIIVFLASYYMLQFRQVGLAGYIESGGATEGYAKETLFIDNNLPVISKLIEIFPNTIQYLGSEVAYYSIVRPVPRALWPGKPEGLSVNIADALNQRGVTLSATFVGEAYMMGGYLAILAVSLVFGWLCGWWNRFGRDLRSNVNVALYASGFFAAMLTMRSMLWLTTAMLPSFAIWLYVRTRQQRRQPRAMRLSGRTPGA